MEKENDALRKPVRYLRGIGPKIGAILVKRGVKTVGDLLYLLPNRYEDKGALKRIEEMEDGMTGLVLGTVASSRPVYYPRARKRAFEATVHDGTGSLILRWFQGPLPYLKETCESDNTLLVSGRVSRFGGRLQMVHPEVAVIDDKDGIEEYERILPVYPEIDGIKQGTLRSLMRRALEDCDHGATSLLSREIEESYGLIPLGEALAKLHCPDETMLDGAMYRRYVERLILEEYFLFQVALFLKKREVTREEGISFTRDGVYRTRFEKSLTFELTGAQRRVIGEIEEDMGRKAPMNRLLQGDVGSGKTVVAVLASSMAISDGYQVAFMAPTEILAEQHYLAIHKAFDDMGVPVAFLRGNMGAERSVILDGIKAGRILVVVGTHALIQKDVLFNNLGLVVIDEQHRFGVIQRKILKEKAGSPDLLVMTATPIPRTLSMVVYGDLDVSVIDEMPKGRKKIETKVYLDKDKGIVYGLIEDELKKGHQAYIVYPLVEESKKIDLLDAKRMAAHFQKSIFASYRVGLLHGKMKAEEKEDAMSRFKDGEIDVLVCTTVIEVGIDVPNATMIVVEHAERFGLSQLHQLRGRVGRGKSAARCALITSEKRTALAVRRLKAMEKTGDGFEIAEEDMRLRGPGEILGVKQSGIPDFRVGDLVRDGHIMSRARRLAEDAMTRLTVDELDRVKNIVKQRWGHTLHLSDVA
ncbi:MAG: ATP-dependent DNA helicase RecG [Syntrophorhabdus sp. PtaU1.Bin002]|nr:MAG: ATP-dependent DNA helicase RecG [Syntrophorhabdus sp. PtaU1.Bin002]